MTSAPLPQPPDARKSDQGEQPELAPVIVFAYARADLLQQTIKALKENPEAPDTTLYVYCDGAKGEADRQAVLAVRACVGAITGFRQVHPVLRERNMGLAASVIAGVSETLASHDRVIVVEDDLITSRQFLRYMNDGLNLYRNEALVASIHGYRYPGPETLPDTYFIRGADCWGWATWARAWEHFEPDGARLLARLRRAHLTRQFDLDGAYPYTQMLKDQIRGVNSSWAIRWHASCFLDNRLTLYPGRSLVVNIGLDGSGTHCAPTGGYDVALSQEAVPMRSQPLVESTVGRAQIKNFFLRERGARTLLQRVRARLRRSLSRLRPRSAV